LANLEHNNGHTDVKFDAKFIVLDNSYQASMTPAPASAPNGQL
jgi:hypothetical protein